MKDCPDSAWPEVWGQIPVLSRRAAQAAGEALHSSQPPKSHGPLGRNLTSGSTGMPLVSLSNEVTRAFWRAITIRDHYWHGRDFTQSLATIRETAVGRADPPHGRQVDNWGSTRGIIETGPGYLLSIQATVEQQVAWLKEQQPGYVLAYPSTLEAIAGYCRQRDLSIPGIREVRTFGEALDPTCRKACEAFFQAPVVDMYSTQELGYVALQCPDYDGYHVQSESLLVEVLDAEGRPCRPGEIGRLVITTLHNFAMPLVRYEVGDYAEVGEPCPCGRGLPTLNRILGRQRNMFLLPGGDRIWPSWADLASAGLESLPPISQFQVVQRTLEEIEVVMVTEHRLTEADTNVLRRALAKALGHDFAVSLSYVSEIPRSRTGKFEDFRSDLAAAEQAG